MNSKIDKIKYALENQIEWQKYAENKNFILFTLTGGTLLAIFSKDDILLKMNASNPMLKIFLLATFISFTLCIISFFVLFFQNKDYKKNGNLISWNFVKKKNLRQLKNIIENYDDDLYLDDLLNEHLIGCVLTSKKYKLFNWGLGIFFLGFVVYIVPILLKLLF